MSCTVCEIEEQLEKDNKAKGNSIPSSRIKVIARRIYEKMKLLETDVKKPESDKEKLKSKCVSDLMDKGQSEASAKSACGNVGKKEPESKVKKENTLVISMPILDPILQQYKIVYSELLQLQLEPINNFQDIKRIEKRQWALKDKMYDIKRAYEGSGVSNYPEEDILIVKIQVQKNQIKPIM